MNLLNIPLNSRYHLGIRKYYELRGIFLKSSRIRDFQERNMKPQISKDSALGRYELEGFTVCT